MDTFGFPINIDADTTFYRFQDALETEINQQHANVSGDNVTIQSFSVDYVDSSSAGFENDLLEIYNLYNEVGLICTYTRNDNNESFEAPFTLLIDVVDVNFDHDSWPDPFEQPFVAKLTFTIQPTHLKIDAFGNHNSDLSVTDEVNYIVVKLWQDAPITKVTVPFTQQPLPDMY